MFHAAAVQVRGHTCVWLLPLLVLAPAPAGLLTSRGPCCLHLACSDSVSTHKLHTGDRLLRTGGPPIICSSKSLLGGAGSQQPLAPPDP